MKNEYIKLGKLEIDNKVLSIYDTDNNAGSLKFRETLSNTEFNSGEEVLNDIMMKLKFLFKKQPIIYSVLNEVSLIQKKEMGFYSVINYMLSGSSLFEKLLNKDTMRNIKNSEFSWSDCLSDSKTINEQTRDAEELDKMHEYKGLKSIEDIHDKVSEIIREQKAKRLIQKTYSNSYRHLVNEETLKLFELFVEKDISISEIHKGFGSKLARYKDLKDSNEGLAEFVRELSGWTKESYIERALSVGASIVHDSDRLLTIKIDNYEQSGEVGAGQWCLAYDKSEFIHYKGIDNHIYFNYDFSKDPSDKLSMCGIVVRSNGKLSDGYWRDDSDVFDGFKEKVERDQLNKFDSLLPKKFTEEENLISFINSAKAQIGSLQKNYFLLSNTSRLKDIDKLDKIFESGELSKQITSSDLKILESIYGNASRSSSDIIKAKKSRNFIKKYIEYSDKIFDTDSINSSFLFKMVDKRDFELMKLYVEKVEETSLEILLNIQNVDIETPEVQKNILDIIEIYGNSINDTPLKFDILDNVYKILKTTDKDMTNFVTDLFKLNDGKIPLFRTLKSLNLACEKEKTEDVNKEINLKTKLVELTLIHMDKKPFNRYFTNKDIKEMFPSIPISTVDKINKYVDKKIVDKKLISKFNI
jgi:predicted DNA-binding protein YlxM (UPF0122 family)